MAYGLLLLRVVFGLTIAAHGAQKVFGWFGGGGLNRWGQIFGTNYQNGVLMAALAGMSELGGVAFAIGLVTPLAALGMVVVMVTAGSSSGGSSLVQPASWSASARMGMRSKARSS